MMINFLDVRKFANFLCELIFKILFFLCINIGLNFKDEGSDSELIDVNNKIIDCSFVFCTYLFCPFVEIKEDRCLLFDTCLFPDLSPQISQLMYECLDRLEPHRWLRSQGWYQVLILFMVERPLYGGCHFKWYNQAQTVTKLLSTSFSLRRLLEVEVMDKLNVKQKNKHIIIIIPSMTILSYSIVHVPILSSITMIFRKI